MVDKTERERPLATELKHNKTRYKEAQLVNVSAFTALTCSNNAHYIEQHESSVSSTSVLSNDS